MDNKQKEKISMMDMLKMGVHFGHKKSKVCPKMNQYIYTTRRGINIIDLSKTKLKLDEALRFVSEIASNNGTILFIGTKKQAKKIVKEAAIRCGMPYVVERWLGGTFTNFDIITKGIKRLEEMSLQRESGELEKKYNKKERLRIDCEIKRLEKKFGGMRKMKKFPDAVFIVDVKENLTAVNESNAKSIPIVALTDTNVDPTLIDYPIPSNDDAIKSIELIVNAVSGTIVDAKSK